MSNRRAIAAYRSGNVSVQEAARIAGVSLAEWFERARNEGLAYRLSTADLEKDVETARKL